MPSYLRIKISIKVIFKNLNLPKGFAVRLRRPAKNASDMAQTFLPSVQGFAGAIPIAGPPMQAAISGLLSILQVIDRRSQNKANLDRLTSRLCRLSSHLCNAPTAQDPIEQCRRDSIIRILQETSAQLTTLQKHRLQHASVTQAIATCSIEIDRYLLESLWSFQMHQSQTMRGPAATQLTAAVILGCVTLVDATGYTHTISVTSCTSFQQVNKMLQVLFECDSIEARVQRQYMEQGQYDLCIDDDKQVTRLTSHEWPSIEAGTTIVMRVIFEEEEEHFRVTHKCHFCSTVNHIDTEYSLQHQAGSSINCRLCGRRFQISREKSSAKRSTQSSDIDSVSITEAETHLIRNFYIQQTSNFQRFENFFSDYPRIRLNNQLQKIYGPSASSRVRWETFAQGPPNNLTWHATIYINDMNYGHASAHTHGGAKDKVAVLACGNLRRERHYE